MSWMLDWASGLEAAFRSILSAPFPGAHVEKKSESLTVDCSENPRMLPTSLFMPLCGGGSCEV